MRELEIAGIAAVFRRQLLRGARLDVLAGGQQLVLADAEYLAYVAYERDVGIAQAPLPLAHRAVGYKELSANSRCVSPSARRRWVMNSPKDFFLSFSKFVGLLSDCPGVRAKDSVKGPRCQ